MTSDSEPFAAGLVPHDVLLRREQGAASERPRTTATVFCDRQRRHVSADECRACPRFARVEVHEAGYVVMCRSGDASEPSDPSGDG